ncbi:MAG: hypothetical protein RQ760_01190 [Sedimentisphaerales bacterium]|nr:hypothetical protein [Sedimentisphaerales bacterium]
MEARNRFVILIAVVLLASVPVQSANQPTAVQISSTHTASCLVKITFDPLVLPLDSITIDYLLHSTSVAGRLIREILNISPDQVSDVFIIETLGDTSGRALPETSPMRRATPTGMNEYEYEMMRERERAGREYTASSSMPGSSRRTLSTTAMPPNSAAEQTILFKLQVNLPENVKPAAEEFMYALVDSFRSTLAKVFEDYKLRFENQLKLAEQEATLAEADLSEKQKTLREISRSHVLDREQILADIYRLRQEVQAAEMNQASNQVIIDATTKRISEIQIEITEKLENDPISIEHQKIIDLIGKLLVEAEKQAKAGTITISQVDEIKERLAREKIAKAQRRESLSKSLGGNLIESLNKELAERSIQDTQQEASLASLEKQLIEAESLLAKADDYELLSLKVDMAKQSLQESILWRDRTSRQIRLLQSPMVSILGGE